MHDYFSRLAHGYDGFVGDFELNSILDYLDLEKSDILVDVGGGTGRVAQSLKNHVRGCVVLDYSYNMLQKAKSKDSDLMLVQASSDAMPFRDGTIKKLFMNDSLHHIQVQEGTIKECERILTEQGKLMIREFNRKHFWNKFLIFGEKLLRFNSKFLSPEELITMCDAVNFKSTYEKPTKGTFILTAVK
jgi:demethylmenaquinone methyltransferase/2-methoxy-6-polyprenyl-1,4-benzoquinol methylase